MNLIKQLVEDIEMSRLEQDALTDPYAEAELTARKFGLVAEDANAEEINRIAAYWRSHGGIDMPDSELRSNVANDLEQLDYSPDEVAKLVQRIMRLVKR